MGVSEKWWIRGSGGGDEGGSSSSFHEEDDTLRSSQYAEVLDLVGEGKIRGWAMKDPVTQQPSALRSIFLDGTPVMNPDGSTNFSNVEVEAVWGTPDQQLNSGFRMPASEYGVQVEVRKDRAAVRTITDPRVSLARVTVSIPQLTTQSATENTLTGASVEFAIDVDAGSGGFKEIKRDKIEGKTTAEYQRAYLIQLTGAAPWRIRIRKLSDDSASTLISNKLYWSSYATIIERRFSYPNSAMIQMRFRAKEFSSAPSRGYYLDLLEVQVPKNYYPGEQLPDGTYRPAEYRTVGPGTTGGVWDGTFKTEWTQSPPWIYYALLTNKTYGLGDKIDESVIDKFALYEIAKFCDELVPDGYGGFEPRFTCNVQFTTRQEALRTLHNLAGAFRAISFWGPSGVMCSPDMDSTPVRIFTEANVEDGMFTYAGSARNSRHNVAIVGWNNPENQFKQEWEYVPDDESIEEMGYVNETEVIALGCTSRGQAHRFGRWIILSEMFRTEVVSFKTGMEGCGVLPGDVIDVQDTRHGERKGGRIIGATLNQLTLDAPVKLKAGSSYTIGVMMPDLTVAYRGVFWNGSVDVETTTIELAAPLTVLPVRMAVWILSDNSAPTSQWRVLGIREAENSMVEISAIEHHKWIYAQVDSGKSFVTPRPIKLPTKPGDIEGLSATLALAKINNTTFTRRLTVSWKNAARAARYSCRYRASNGNWIQLSTVPATFDVDSVAEGVAYTIEVKGVNALGESGNTSQIVWNGTAGGVEPDVTGLVCVDAIAGKISSDDFRFSWTKRDSCRYRVQIVSVPEAQPLTSETVGDLTAASIGPEYSVIRDQIVTTPNYTYAFSDNFQDTLRRKIMCRVAYVSEYGTSAHWKQVVVENPPPAAPTWSVKEGAGQITATALQSSEPDVVGVAMWIASSNIPDNPGAPAYKSPGLSHSFIALISGNTYYLRAAYYDKFGIGALTTNTSAVPTGTGGLNIIQDASQVTAPEGTEFPPAGPDWVVIYDEATASMMMWNAHKHLEDGTVVAGYDRPDKLLAERVDVLDEFKDRATIDIRTVNDTLTQTTATLSAADVQLGQRIDNLTTSVGTTNAAVQTEISARSQADAAISQSVTTLSTTVAGNTASITNINQTLNGVKASWGVKLDVNGKVSGVYQYNNGQQSAFLIDADNVYCLNLSSLSANLGYCSAGAFEVSGGPIGDGWGGVFSSGKTAGDQSVPGFSIMRHITGAFWMNMKSARSEFTMSSWGTNHIEWKDANGATRFKIDSGGNVYARGDIEASSLKVNSVYTQSINDEAVTVLRNASSSSGGAIAGCSCSCSIYLNEAAKATVIYSALGGSSSVTLNGSQFAGLTGSPSMYYNGPYGTNPVYSHNTSGGASGSTVVTLQAGWNTVVASAGAQNYIPPSSSTWTNSGVPTSATVSIIVGKK